MNFQGSTPPSLGEEVYLFFTELLDWRLMIVGEISHDLHVVTTMISGVCLLDYMSKNPSLSTTNRAEVDIRYQRGRGLGYTTESEK